MAIVSQELVISMLRKYNIWWRTPGLIREESKPQKRQAFFKAMEIITHGSLRRFAVLSGARRVGKTTIMYAEGTYLHGFLGRPQGSPLREGVRQTEICNSLSSNQM